MCIKLSFHTLIAAWLLWSQIKAFSLNAKSLPLNGGHTHMTPHLVTRHPTQAFLRSRYNPLIVHQIQPIRAPLTFELPQHPDGVLQGNYNKKPRQVILHKHVHEGKVEHVHKHQGENKHVHKHEGHGLHKHQHEGQGKHLHKHEGHGDHSHVHKGRGQHEHKHQGFGKHEHDHFGNAGHKHEHMAQAMHGHDHKGHSDHLHQHHALGEHIHDHYGRGQHKHKHSGYGKHGHHHYGESYHDHKHKGYVQIDHEHPKWNSNLFKNVKDEHNLQPTQDEKWNNQQYYDSSHDDQMKGRIRREKLLIQNVQQNNENYRPPNRQQNFKDHSKELNAYSNFYAQDHGQEQHNYRTQLAHANNNQNNDSKRKKHIRMKQTGLANKPGPPYDSHTEPSNTSHDSGEYPVEGEYSDYGDYTHFNIKSHSSSYF